MTDRPVAFASRLALRASTIFGISWRLAILALPWQTRWIFSKGVFAGFPWEQGTVAVYVSWALLMATVIAFFVGMGLGGQEGSGRKRIALTGWFLPVVPLIGVSLFTVSWTATALWWLHVILLGAFGWTLVRAQIRFQTIAYWIVLSLIPHAALGLWQAIRQDLIGSAWLGMATQHPWDSGVSVVEHGLYRVLRAYGGFPHPNIFGGWLAVGLSLIPALSLRSKSNAQTIFFSGIAALFALVLVLTFSRAAWLAALFGIGLAHWSALKRASDSHDRQALWIVHAAILIALAAGTLSQWDHVQARFIPQHRLERWSIEQRQSSLENGFRAWLRRPMAGWGAGTSVIAIDAVRTGSATVASEPPHALPLVALLETGVIGVLALMVFVSGFVRASLRTTKLSEMIPIVVVFLILSLFDHYLWTLWAGQTLAMLGIVLSLPRNPTYDN